MGNCCQGGSPDGPGDDIGRSNVNVETIAPIELPPGWKAVPSRSRPGKVAYQNINTGERIAWVPTEEAKTYKGGISKKKKKHAKKPDTSDGAVGDDGNKKNGTQTTQVNGENSDTRASS